MRNLQFKRYKINEPFSLETAERNTIHIIPTSLNPLTVVMYDVDAYGNVAEVSTNNDYRLVGIADFNTIPESTGKIKYQIITPGEYPNFTDQLGIPIIVTENELSEFSVYIGLSNGINSEKLLETINSSIYNDESKTIATDIINRIDKETGINLSYKEVENWYDGTPMTLLKTDGILYLKQGSKYYSIQVENSLNFNIFSGNGKTVNENLVSACNFCSRYRLKLDGQNKIYKFSSFTELTLDFFHMENFDFRLTNDYLTNSGLSIISDEITFKNIKCEGGRGTYKTGKEKWVNFFVEKGINSIMPDIFSVFQFVSKTSNAIFNIDQINIKNIHAIQAIIVRTLGNVNFGYGYFENCSYKPLHIYHTFDDGVIQSGISKIDFIHTKNCGFLADSIIEEGIETTRDASVGMPQWAYGVIISFGTTFINRAYIEEYGSTGVCTDRQIEFTANSITVDSLTNKGFSNNPSSAFWSEASKKVSIETLICNIKNRHPRELSSGIESSALQCFNDDVFINNFLVNGHATVNKLNCVIRCSYGMPTNLTINNIQSTGKFDFFMKASIFPDAFSSSKVNIKGGNIQSGDIINYGINDFSIDKLTAINSNIFLYNPVLNTSVLMEITKITNSSFQNFSTEFKRIKNLEITNCRFGRAVLSAINLNFNYNIVGYFEIHDVAYANINYNIVKNQSPQNSIVLYYSTILKHISLTYNKSLIKIGTEGAGFLHLAPEYDINNLTNVGNFNGFYE